MYDYYLQEKLMELRNERAARRASLPQGATATLFDGVIRAGGALKRLGERLEGRAPAPEAGRWQAWAVSDRQ